MNMKAYIYYDKELEDLDKRRIINCLKESVCPNEALRGASKRFKKLYESNDSFEVMLDYKYKSEFKDIKVIEVDL